MSKMITVGLTTAMLVAGGAIAQADPIEGTWKTGNCDGDKVSISSCGGKLCVDIIEGDYTGKRSGKLSALGGNEYSGTLKQFSTGISFKGVATLNGNRMKMIAKKFGVVVKRQNWCRS